MDDGSGTTNGSRHGVTEAAHRGDERTALLGFLQRQRDLLVWKLGDAPDDVLRSVATPSGLASTAWSATSDGVVGEEPGD